MYERRYIEELMDTDQIGILEIRDQEDGTIHYAVCDGLTEDDAWISDPEGNVMRLSEKGTAEHIFWFSKLDYTDPNAPEEAVRVVNKAVSFVGTDDEPLHSNNVIFNYDFLEGARVKEDDYWCAVFVWDVFRMCGLSGKFCGGRKIQDCIDILTWGRKEHRLVSKDDIRYGDIALYNWDDTDDIEYADNTIDHTDIIIRENPDGTLLSIAGCTSELDDTFSGHVNIRKRKKDQLAAIVRPRYE